MPGGPFDYPMPPTMIGPKPSPRFLGPPSPAGSGMATNSSGIGVGATRGARQGQPMSGGSPRFLGPPTQIGGQSSHPMPTPDPAPPTGSNPGVGGATVRNTPPSPGVTPGVTGSGAPSFPGGTTVGPSSGTIGGFAGYGQPMPPSFVNGSGPQPQTTSQLAPNVTGMNAMSGTTVGSNQLARQRSAIGKLYGIPGGYA